MNVKAVFFDLDGTLLDTAADLGGALNHLLIAKGKQALPDATVRQVVSDGAYALLKLGFNVEKTHPETAALRKELLDLYSKNICQFTTVFDGLDTLIENFVAHDIAWGIVTNKPAPYAEPLMAYFKFASDPVCLICPEHVTERKPHPESLELACKFANCEPRDCVYIGDHLRDIQCGNRAGMRTIAVKYGYTSPGENIQDWGADYLAESGHDIWPIIQSL